MTHTQNLYDDQAFFEGYKKLRDNLYSANNLEEKPALFSLAPDLHGKRVLDLGCGYGENCKAFCDLGASYVLGVDLSEKMLEPTPTAEALAHDPKWEKCFHKPNFLLIRAGKM